MRIRSRFVALIAAAALGLAGCSSSEDTSDQLDPNADLTKQSLVISNWAGYYPEDLAAKFQEAVGPSVTITNHATNEEIMAKLTAGSDSGVDVAFVSGQFAQALAEQ
ncbi:MAG: spermidine/putrescine ABC transporter substrate-binding protein, partial [Candidatus Nanopelagicales bacterium]